MEYCYISHQHIILKLIKTRGKEPAIDYFINSKINTYIELIRDSHNLEEHFDRFELKDGHYSTSKPYAILDIICTDTVPAKLPQKYSKLGHRYYSFVKQTNKLYQGSKVINECVSSNFKSHPYSTLRVVKPAINLKFGVGLLSKVLKLI